MEVIILAGGFGTRLRSVVNEVPKCMAPIAIRGEKRCVSKFGRSENI